MNVQEILIYINCNYRSGILDYRLNVDERILRNDKIITADFLFMTTDVTFCFFYGST